MERTVQECMEVERALINIILRMISSIEMLANAHPGCKAAIVLEDLGNRRLELSQLYKDKSTKEKDHA
jgi:hypothetical protein